VLVTALALPAQRRRHLRALAFEQGKDLARTPQHWRREPSEPANLDAVRAIGTTRLQTMEKQHLRRSTLRSSHFTNRDVIVADCV
jgi:hypothetical protein